MSEDGRRSIACRLIRCLLDLRPVDALHLRVQPPLQFLCCLRLSLAPTVEACLPLFLLLYERLTPLGEALLNLGENDKGVVRIAAQTGDGATNVGTGLESG